MADMYWDQPTDASQEQPPSPEPDEPPASPEEAPEFAPAPAERAPDERLHEELRRVVLDDVSGYEQALRDAGFSESEARRLVFERMRPREEGLTRREG